MVMGEILTIADDVDVGMPVSDLVVEGHLDDSKPCCHMILPYCSLS